MRRKEKEITVKAEIEDVIARAQICRLAMVDGDTPYIVPLNFGYSQDTLYFHAAKEGRKLEVLRKNPKVCFEFDICHEIEKADAPCKWGVKYESVIGTGRATLIADQEAKKKALDVIIAHYGGDNFEYLESGLKACLVIQVVIDEMAGKRGL